MYASIRRHYFNPNLTDDVLSWAKLHFVGQLQDIEGFVSYQGMDLGDGELLFVTVFENKSGAEEANRLATEASETRWRDLERGPPLMDVGRVRVSVN